MFSCRSSVVHCFAKLIIPIGYFCTALWRHTDNRSCFLIKVSWNDSTPFLSLLMFININLEESNILPNVLFRRGNVVGVFSEAFCLAVVIKDNFSPLFLNPLRDKRAMIKRGVNNSCGTSNDRKKPSLLTGPAAGANLIRHMLWWMPPKVLYDWNLYIQI